MLSDLLLKLLPGDLSFDLEQKLMEIHLFSETLEAKKMKMLPLIPFLVKMTVK